MIKTLEEQKKYRVLRLESLIDDVLKDIAQTPEGHWSLGHFKVRLKEYQLEYKEITGREYERRFQ